MQRGARYILNSYESLPSPAYRATTVLPKQRRIVIKTAVFNFVNVVGKIKPHSARFATYERRAERVAASASFSILHSEATEFRISNFVASVNENSARNAPRREKERERERERAREINADLGAVYKIIHAALII